MGMRGLGVVIEMYEGTDGSASKNTGLFQADLSLITFAVIVPVSVVAI